MDESQRFPVFSLQFLKHGGGVLAPAWQVAHPTITRHIYIGEALVRVGGRVQESANVAVFLQIGHPVTRIVVTVPARSDASGEDRRGRDLRPTMPAVADKPVCVALCHDSFPLYIAVLIRW